jgi:uncharacterized iron-regulated protein
MILGQRVRDIVMTESLLNSQSPLKVLIAGAGHVRNDRGVPVYIHTQTINARILALGFVEVDDESGIQSSTNKRAQVLM